MSNAIHACITLYIFNYLLNKKSSPTLTINVYSGRYIELLSDR